MIRRSRFRSSGSNPNLGQQEFQEVGHAHRRNICRDRSQPTHGRHQVQFILRDASQTLDCFTNSVDHANEVLGIAIVQVRTPGVRLNSLLHRKDQFVLHSGESPSRRLRSIAIPRAYESPLFPSDATIQATTGPRGRRYVVQRLCGRCDNYLSSLYLLCSGAKRRGLPILPKPPRLHAAVTRRQANSKRPPLATCSLGAATVQVRGDSRENIPRRRMMLVLSRKKGEEIVIGEAITMTIVEIRGDKVRVGIAAPPEIPVHRREVKEAIDRAEAKQTPR